MYSPTIHFSRFHKNVDALVKCNIAVNVWKEKWELAKLLVVIILIVDTISAAMLLPKIKYPRELTFFRAFLIVYPSSSVQRLVSTLVQTVNALVPTLVLLFLLTALITVVSLFVRSVLPFFRSQTHSSRQLRILFWAPTK